MTGYPPERIPVPDAAPFDWDRLAGYLRANLDGLGPLEAVWQFPNGSANLTYLLEFAGQRLVVRRPPFGNLAIGAHDMRREYQVLSRLWPHYDRAPRAYLFCADHTVAGADFVVMEYRAGEVVWGSVPPSMTGHPGAARRIGFAVVDALAELHQLAPERADVADLGRPAGFVDRQLAGWLRRWQAVSPEPAPDIVAEVAAKLAATRPQSTRTAIVHNDFKIDNCQFDPADPDRVTSVFDWDMATLGDPLVDVGILLNYWPDPSDGPHDRPLHPAGQERMGLPARAEVAQHYAAQTGADVSGIAWYEAFGCWKTAIVIAQLHYRYRAGHSQDERQAAKGARVLPLAHRAWSILAAR